MYYQNYEDYMKNVLGPRYTPDYMMQEANNQYPYGMYTPTYAMPMNNINSNLSPMQQYNSIPVSNNNFSETRETSSSINYEVKQTEEVAKVRKMYPEIYTLLTPMIDKTVAENKEKEITEELVETMTDAIYTAIQDDMNVKQVNTVPTTSSTTNMANNRNNNTSIKQVQNTNSVSVARRPGNHTLRDLIKILLINSLINNLRPNRPGARPPERPNRPPMPRSYETMNYFSVPYPEDEYIG